MIIRKLRPDERAKNVKLMGIAFNYPVDTASLEGQTLYDNVIGAFCDDGETLMAQIYLEYYMSRFGNSSLEALGIAGVSSAPEFRRSGAIRAIFNKILAESNCAVSYLYPSSYDYYSKFGFATVMEVKGITYPISLIRQPVWRNAVLCDDSSYLPELLSIYGDYSKEYDVIFERSDGSKYDFDPHSSKNLTYLIKDENGRGIAYVKLKLNGKNMFVGELCYRSIDALRKTLGFLRLFEGQADKAEFFGIPENSPLTLLLSEKNSAETLLYGSAMGRILDVERVLSAAKYPESAGAFSVKVIDPIVEKNNAIFDVEYGGNYAEVSVRDGGEYDLSLDIADLSRVVLSGYRFTELTVNALESLQVKGSVEDFLAAFPGNSVALHDHF
ncbi:MAG: GNAT family N-acetyltransferase [Firmicutes bacterium]|nr:GNAT family N-acetyltransferase [Bacillota bacterium]